MKKFLLGFLFVISTFTTMAAGKEISKYSIKAKGNVNMRMSYDFDGIIANPGNPDFIPASISVNGNDNGDQKFYMDATTSRIGVEGLAKSETLGDVKLYVELDFRGGSLGSYTPRLRMAYVSLKDFMIGRNYTSWADMGVAGPNIDFEGPCICPYIYTTQIRYTHTFDSNISVGAALEYHDYSSNSLADNSDIVKQEIKTPLVPAHIQYAWNSQQGSHIRLSGLYKNIALRDNAADKNINLAAWGTQLSGSFGIGKNVKLLYSGTCGEGITDFIQDLYGSGLDTTINTTTEKPRMTLVNGFQLVGIVNATDRLMFSTGYSQVNVEGDESRFAQDDIHKTEYAFGNVFYNLTSNIQIGAEYLWGKRTNVDNASNTANRINTVFQYNF